jgi:hypothetical protein
MKAILKFDLDDAEDRMAHLRAVQSTDLSLALWHIMYNTKKTLEEKTDQDLDEVYDTFWKVLEEYNINLDKLIV